MGDGRRWPGWHRGCVCVFQARGTRKRAGIRESPAESARIRDRPFRERTLTMLKDLRFAVRMLTRARGFTATALIVLTLGIGATATMFSATNAVLFRRLPYPDADRIVVARETRAQAGFEKTVLSAREYLDWIRDSAVIEQ